MVDYTKEPVQGEPASHTAARKTAIKAAAEKTAATRAAAIKRNASSNSAAHDKAIEQAKEELLAGYDLMARGDRAIGLGQQRIAHGLLTLDREEAFPVRLNFAKWFMHSPEQVKTNTAYIKAVFPGDAPDKPQKGEHSVEYANAYAAWRAKGTAVTRAIPLAAAFAILANNANKKIPTPQFDEKKGWHVPVWALCEKGQTPRNDHDMTYLDNTSRVVTVERVNDKGQKTESLMSVRCSVDQVVKAVRSRHVKAAATGNSATNKGTNDANARAEKANTFGPLSVTVLAAKPEPLLTLWHEMARTYRSENLAMLNKGILATIRKLHEELGVFIRESTTVTKKVNELPTTEAGRSALVKGDAAKAAEAKG